MFNEKGNYQYPGDMVKSTYDSNNDGVVNAADSVPWSGVTNTPDTLSGYGIEEVPASVLSGVIDIEHIPPSAVERMKIVENDSMRFALTTADVQNGDTVKVTSTNKMYLVVDDDNLDSESGYAVYVAGRAAAVDWTGVENKPETIENIDTEIGDLKDATESLEDQMTQKANIDGTYEDMTVGTAEAVLSESFTADSVPYHFRQTPFGDRLKEKIIGGTVAWNQLVPFTEGMTWSWNGIQFSFNNGKISASGTAEVNATGAIFPSRVYSKIKPIKDHVYYVHFNGDFTFPSMYLSIYGSHTQSVDMTVKRPRILKCTVDNATDAEPVASAVASTSYTADFSIYLCDLTALFNPEIADYIYNLEQTTAGAGVALFRKLFPKNYYPFNAGELLSVSGLVSHDEIGKNLLNQEDINVSTPTTWLNKEIYLPAGTYTYSMNSSATSGQCTLEIFNANNDIIYYSGDSYNLSLANPVRTFTLKETGVKVCSYINTVSKLSNCQIEFGSARTDYEPYKKHSYPLDSSLTLRGVPKLVDNKIKFDGDVYESDGKVTRRYGVVDLGTLNWIKNSSGERFYATVNGASFPTTFTKLGNVICEIYTNVTYTSMTQNPVNRTIAASAGNGVQYLSIVDYDYTDAAAFKSAMSGVYLVYELATPTEETAQPYQSPQRCFEGGTEEYVTTGIVPVGHESEYYENIAAKVDGLPYDLSMIAPIENGTTASKAYSTGQYFLHNDQFCKAKTNIASGATFTLNTNYEVTTVANELYTALH